MGGGSLCDVIIGGRLETTGRGGDDFDVDICVGELRKTLRESETTKKALTKTDCEPRAHYSRTHPRCSPLFLCSCDLVAQ